MIKKSIGKPQGQLEPGIVLGQEAADKQRQLDQELVDVIVEAKPFVEFHVHRLLRFGASPCAHNSKKNEPVLVSATNAGLTQVVCMLIKNFKAQGTPEAIDQQDGEGNTALMRAIINGNGAIFELLGLEGASFNCLNKSNRNAYYLVDKWFTSGDLATQQRNNMRKLYERVLSRRREIVARAQKAAQDEARKKQRQEIRELSQAIICKQPKARQWEAGGAKRHPQSSNKNTKPKPESVVKSSRAKAVLQAHIADATMAKPAAGQPAVTVSPQQQKAALKPPKDSELPRMIMHYYATKEQMLNSRPNTIHSTVFGPPALWELKHFQRMVITSVSANGEAMPDRPDCNAGAWAVPNLKF